MLRPLDIRSEHVRGVPGQVVLRPVVVADHPRVRVAEAVLDIPNVDTSVQGWLENARIEGDHVVGEVVEDRMLGHDIYGTMNFPLTCVRRWDDGGEGSVTDETP